jgi:Ca-activated chloride channel family protein
LLEQVDYKRFEMRIFPIPAGAEQRVRVTYYQELEFDHDRASYIYPLATVAAGQPQATTSGRFSFALDVKSEVPIVELKSPSHPEQFVLVQHADKHYWQASLENNAGDLSRDLVIHYGLERPATGLDLITSKQQGEDGYFQLTVTAGPELETELKGSDYVFVVDVSGSMRNDGKLALSRGAVEAFVQSLGEQDRFDVITFNIAANTLFNEATSATTESKQRAAEYLASQRAMGGTVLRPAIEAAYRYRDSDRQLNVVVLSDGMTDQRDQPQLLQLIRERPAGASVFCVGIGNEVNRPLLAQLAEETGGLAAFISTTDDFEAQAQAFRRKLTRPAAANVKFVFEGAEVYDVEPATLPNLYHGQPVRMYGRYKNSGPAKVTLRADVLGSPLEKTVDVTLPATDDANPEIERMWAQHRVERLMSEGRRDGSKSHLAEIVRLCEGYSIASEYASFIVLENDAEYQRWKIERKNATRLQRDRQAQLAVRERLSQLQQQTAQQIGPRADKTAQSGAPEPQQPTQLAQANSQPVAPIADAAPAQPDLPGRDFGPRFSIDAENRGGGQGGGGAIDPISALVAAGLAGLGWACRRKPRSV